jgi:hypothetical protein
MAELPPAGSRPASPTPAKGVVRCAVCGNESRQPPFRPQPPEQAPDLDLRPGEPLRSTMTRWLQQCPRCGYAAPDIASAHPAAAAAVAAAPFRALLADALYPPLARRFLAWAHVLEETGALHAAAEATLQAAWVADDAGRADLARQWRLDAVSLWRQGPPLDPEQTVRIVDALRRAGAFDDAAATADAALAAGPPEEVREVLVLERRLALAGDEGRYTLASAMPPPARRPHAAQRGLGAAPGGKGLFGWLKRLFGRG